MAAMSSPKSASFPFAVFLISVSSTKALHLLLHLRSVPLYSFFLYLPTLCVSDIILITIVRVLLRRERGSTPSLGLYVGEIVS